MKDSPASMLVFPMKCRFFTLCERISSRWPSAIWRGPEHLAMTPRTSSSDKPSRHQKGDLGEETKVSTGTERLSSERQQGSDLLGTQSDTRHHLRARRLLPHAAPCGAGRVPVG
ncbi:hypothetical protein EYF80_054674 [Liparis tanakae]|uniref:Uncharacterized protein n=1 Tax=Liparis tanakae TaxID=230148 RepID=A0A4Z2F3T6_9TELE|nr:hypothetical protein EYF80_054674 [Liparis tanakae]